MGSPLAADLDESLRSDPGVWEGLRGARVFITGGTGFFGTWLVESLVHANRALGLGARATILTRDENAFLAKNPHLAGARELTFHRGDVRAFDLPGGAFSHVVHAATEASAKLNREQPQLMREVVVEGTRRVLELCRRAGAPRLLLTSSGAVYGPQRPETTHVAEDDPGVLAPLTAPDAYAEGKREAERLCVEACGPGFAATIARGFAFVGPHLPLDAHFAIGNFIRDALAGGPIKVGGDGTPLRSYLYGSDLAVWLWTILLRGEPGRAYNVGSERSVSIVELARAVAGVVDPKAQIRVAAAPTPGKPPSRYVPSTARARRELGLRETVPLEEAIRKTAAWARDAAAGPAR